MVWDSKHRSDRPALIGRSDGLYDGARKGSGMTTGRRLRPRSWIAVAIITLLTSTLAVSGEWFRKTPIKQSCRIPAYAYQVNQPGNPRRETTTTLLRTDIDGESVSASKIGSSAAGSRQLQVRSFQLSASSLRADHCSLSRVVVSIVDDGAGTWHARFVARQNPADVPQRQRPAAERFKRNRFYVELRGISSSAATDSGDDSVLGPPVWFRIRIPPFWMEKGATRELYFTGQNTDVARFFSATSRVEAQLSIE